MNLVLIIFLATALMASAAILAILISRLRRQRAVMETILSATGSESPEEAAGSLARLTDREVVAGIVSTRLKQLLATYPKPVLLLDESAAIIDLSRKAETELEQPRRKRGLLESLGSHDLDEAVRRAMDRLEPQELTVRLHAHGRRPYAASIFPFRNSDRRECVVFLEDVSTPMKFGELRSQFAATVSHELRTPLAGIRVLVESLRDQEMPKEEAVRFLTKIEAETARLRQLIEEILFLSRLESGAAESIRGETVLRPLADQILKDKEQLIGKFEVKVENMVPDGLSLPLNERMATTVLSNLIDNAIKYSGRGSRVEISAGEEGNRVEFMVRDDGIGIDAEHLPHIFERFYRVDRSRSRRLGGTGLGLSIVKHIVESAGGEVQAISREGFGTEMTVTLPASGIMEP
ncbi:MAG: ATP-binding protein [Thermoleophilia bacterium]|nr:ATP-binding protein [Thermoleophilia bacterium]